MSRLVAWAFALAACSGGSSGPEVECGAPGEQIRLPSDEPVGCTHVLGSVHVPDAVSADTLASLRTVRRIDGTFTIFRSHALVDLGDLAALQEVGGELSIRFDEGLVEELAGLAQLREVGALTIELNAGLRRLGLQRLALVRGDLVISNNPALPQAEIDALLGAVQVDGEIVVEGNAR